MATGRKCDINRWAIQKRKHQDGELALATSAGEGPGSFLLNKRGDILADKTKQHKQAALAAAKRQTFDTHLHFSLSKGIRGHAFARAQAPKP